MKAIFEQTLFESKPQGGKGRSWTVFAGPRVTKLPLPKPIKEYCKLDSGKDEI
jgi:hypothetical protein